MPGPIAHAAMGYAIYRIFQPYMPKEEGYRVGPIPLVMAGAVGFSLAPDLDAVPALLLNDFTRFHNNLTHSTFIGIALAASTGAAAWSTHHSGPVKWALLGFVSYQLHLVMDLLTYNTRGLMLFWPLSIARFEGPVALFYGVRWSEGLVSFKHITTVISELAFATFLIAAIWLATRWRITRRLHRCFGSQARQR